MATTGEAQFITCIASEDLTGSEYRAVIIATPVNGVPGVALPGSAGVKALGVLAGDQDVLTSGAAVKVCISGKYKIEANGAFSLDDELGIAADTGRVDTATATQYSVARALSAASNQGDIVPCLVIPGNTAIVTET